MGLIKAVLGAAGGALADQWKEFFYCDAISAETLVVRGQKKITGRSSNTKGNDNIISNGSVIAVADGQAMAIVEQGKVVEFCAEPGEFKWDSSTEPSIFAGSLGTSILDTFKAIGRRITFGGDTGKDQRVYYFNLKEITDNKFGTANPIPFRIVINEELGFKLSADLRVSGVYSYKIVDPILFYTNVCANVTVEYRKSEIDSMMKGELLTALQPALSRIAGKGIQYYEIGAHSTEVRDELSAELNSLWREKRGIEIWSFNPSSLTIPDEQKKKITEWEENAMTLNPNVGAARIVGATSDAMRTAAGNESGAMNGFIGMGMAQGVGGTTAQNLYAMGAQPAAPAANAWICPTCGKSSTGKFCAECGTKKPEPKSAGAWTCPTCGTVAAGKFCPECGTKKPEESGAWTCSCGQVNTGKFCSACGAKKPAADETWTCSCGQVNKGKFCSSCGAKKA